MTGPARRPECPTDVGLEEYLLGEPGAVRDHASHVSSCDSCGERLEWMRAAGLRFQEVVYPATASAVRASVRPPPRRALRLLWLAALPAAAALALLVRTSPTPQEGYIGVKGEPVALEVFASEEGTVRRLADGDRVLPTAGLRFVARAPGRSVLLVSVDETGKVSRLQPAAGEPPRPADGLLAGGARLDGLPGPERIFAVFVGGDAKLDDVERAAREAFAGGGAERVRSLRRLPIPVEQESLLLEKAGPR